MPYISTRTPCTDMRSARRSSRKLVTLIDKRVVLLLETKIGILFSSAAVTSSTGGVKSLEIKKAGVFGSHIFRMTINFSSVVIRDEKATSVRPNNWMRFFG